MLAWTVQAVLALIARRALATAERAAMSDGLSMPVYRRLSRRGKLSLAARI
jgi:hypothetical protein